MLNLDSCHMRDDEVSPLDEDVFVALVAAVQNLGRYGEYAREKSAVFANINHFENNIVVTPNVPIAEHPTHQDSGEILVKDKNFPEDTFLNKMRVWTPYEGSTTRPFKVDGREDAIANLWRDSLEVNNNSAFILVTTLGRRAYEVYRESPREKLVVDEIYEDDKAEMYIDDILSFIDTLAASYPEISKINSIQRSPREWYS